MAPRAYGQITWSVDRCQFEFESESDAADWVDAGNPVNFVFALDSADNSDEIFGIEDVEIENIQLESSEFTWLLEGVLLTINAAHAFPIELATGVTEEDFAEWVEESGGSFCGVISVESPADVSELGCNESATVFVSLDELNASASHRFEAPTVVDAADAVDDVELGPFHSFVAPNVAAGIRSAPRLRRFVMRALAVLPLIWLACVVPVVVWDLLKNPFDAIRWLLWIVGGLVSVSVVIWLLTRSDQGSGGRFDEVSGRINLDGSPDRRYKANRDLI